MSIQQQITHLERLVSIDAHIKQLEETIKAKRGGLGGLRDELSDVEDRISTDQKSVEEMDKTRNELMLEIRQVEEQISRSRERLQRARNSREANAAERELDELRKIRRDRDDEIKKLSELGQHAREAIVKANERKDELSSTLEGSLEGTTHEIDGLEAELAEAKEGRKEVASKLPRLLVRRYDRLHSRGKVPVAKTHDGTCLGCFVKLPPMLFHEMLSQREFSECPQCHRILYYEPPKAEGDGDDASDATESSS